MRIKCFLTVMILSVFSVNAQISGIFTADTVGQQHLSLHTSAFFGQDWYNRNFTMTDFGADFSKKLTPKTTLFAGGSIFRINTSRPLEDKAPRQTNRAMIYAGVSHQFNDNFMLSADVFYNGIYNSIGANVDMIYKLSEDSFIEFSASFQHRLNTSANNYAVPYGYYDVFHPTVLGY